MNKRILLSLITFFLLCNFTPATFAKAEKVLVKTTPEKGYYLEVNGKPIFIKGVIYNPTPIGEGYTYDLFSDKNKPWLVDGKLMKQLGINCVRVYSAGEDMEKVKEFINDMYSKFGIYTIVSDWLGLWSYPGVNYADVQFQKSTKERILKIVNALKDEKGLLMWVLGNENSYTFSGKICFWTAPEIEKLKDLREKIYKRAEIYYSFVDELAQEIKKIDSNHPVALGNGEETFLDVAAKLCTNIDVLAIISYKGKKFGNLFHRVQDIFDKPIFISEFGCESYDAYSNKENQDIQTEYLISQWQDLYDHTVFGKDKKGNCIGGSMFEWTDEWWKHNEGYTPDWVVHNGEAGWSNGSYYYDIKANNALNMNEEWFGIVSLAEKKENSIDKRIPKKSYYTLKDFFSRLPKSAQKIK
ncbi:MAG: glycoside hydrolase family 2 TIM barrel-domain containing protein [Candidatus Omnitrophota bacterium]|nr:glycoside hydrolase family 2 TIM barrel-domain containing protein [Candidatus Omnitrophota bacterium]